MNAADNRRGKLIKAISRLLITHKHEPVIDQLKALLFSEGWHFANARELPDVLLSMEALGTITSSMDPVHKERRYRSAFHDAANIEAAKKATPQLVAAEEREERAMYGCTVAEMEETIQTQNVLDHAKQLLTDVQALHPESMMTRQLLNQVKWLIERSQ